VIDDEVRATLRELVDELGAVSARVSDVDDSRTGVPARTVALGGGEHLRVELATRSGKDVDVEATLERATRQLRSIRRRWEVTRLPEVHVTSGAPPAVPGEKIIERIAHFLKALATIDRATNAFVTRGTILVACARPPDELENSRWPFLARRALGTHAPGSSHGEIVDPDAYAMSFYYDCALVLLLAEPYAEDFVRHRCKHVAREIAVLLPLLDPGPEAPAAVRRKPPTIP
jgi:hypothetical protein